VRRLASSYDAHSVPGHGTVISAALWHGSPERDGAYAGLTRTLAGETQCGDALTVRPVDSGWLLLAVDGLGHGPLAASASASATRLFRESTHVSPLTLVRELDRGMSRTRGGAVAIAHLDLVRGRLAYCAIGNIAGRIVSGAGSRGLVTHPGIVGHNARAAREAVYEVAPGDWVVLHSDGLTDKWSITDYPGILARSPVILAATLLREAGVRHDDASVLVTKVTG
jgi:serine phosphatase RsbU (regulator of sigma subunit)